MTTLGSKSRSAALILYGEDPIDIASSGVRERRYRLASQLLAFAAASAGVMIPYPWWRHGGSPTSIFLGFVLASAWLLLFRLLVGISRRSVIALCVVAVGVSLRVAGAGLAASGEPANDALSYSTLAHSLLNGNGLAAWSVRAHYPPLYPIILATVSRLSGSIPLAALAINIIADGASAIVLWWIARRSVDEHLAQLAAATFFLWPALLVDGGAVQKESLTVAIALAIMLATIRCFEGERWACAAASLGGLWGLMGLCQPGLVTLPIFTCTAMAVKQRGARRTGAILALATLTFVLVMVPWWIRNYALFGQFVPFTTVGGLMFSGPVNEVAVYAAKNMPGGEAQQATWSLHNALKIIIAHPGTYFLNAILHGARAILLDVGEAEQFFWIEPVRWPNMLIVLMTACQAAWAFLWGLAALGVRRASGIHFALLASLAAQFAVVNVWLQFGERHRLVLMPVLILMAVRASGQWRIAKPTKC